jgi:L-alanine-DL-glutamate epimerase-like enolase superfamily enzyme
LYTRSEILLWWGAAPGPELLRTSGDDSFVWLGKREKKNVDWMSTPPAVGPRHVLGRPSCFAVPWARVVYNPGMQRRQFLGSAAASAALSAAKLRAATEPLRREIKVTRIETDLLRFPPGRLYHDAIQTFGADGGGVVLRVFTDAGVTGWAYSSFGRLAGGPDTVQTILEKECAPVLLGQDPTMTRKIRADLWRALDYHGVQGVTHFAVSAVDIALWDIVGKSLETPVYRLLGGARDRIPAYAMVGWYYENDDDLSAFRHAVESAFEEGFGAVKIKVGGGPLDDDVRRVRAALDLAGKDRRVLVDANQALNTNEAIRRGRVYQEMGCFWFEEPLPPWQKDGYAELAAALDIRIATGENEYTKYSFLELMQRKAADVVQPDNRRAGGVTEWVEIASLAAAFGIEVASHGGGGMAAQMLCTMPHAIYLESGSLKNQNSHLQKLRMVDGQVLAPDMAGIGSELEPGYIQKYRV